MNYKIFLALILFLGFGNIAKSQTLEDYLKLAAESNPLLQAKYAEFEAALQKVAQENSLPDPTVSFGYFISPVETRVGPQQAKIGLSQMFPWFGTLKTAGNVYQLQADSKYQEFLNTKNELYMQVKSAWYPLYEVNQKIKLQTENRDILSTYKELATSRFKNGKSTMVDVIRIDIMIENANTEITLLNHQLQPLRVQFNTLLNRATMEEVIVKDLPSIGSIPDNYRKDSILFNHPILRSFDLKYQSAQQAEELAKKQGMPKLGVGLDYVIVGQGNNSFSDNGKDVFMPMVSMSVPIFRGKYKAATKVAQYNQVAINYQKEAFANNLVSGYEMAWYEIVKSYELIQLYAKQIETTHQVIRLLMSAYSNSGKDFEEVLRMQQELLKYQMAEAVALKDYYTALAKIDYLTAKTE